MSRTTSCTTSFAARRAACAALGVRPEERVALVLLDSLELVVTFLAAMRIGAIPLPAEPVAARPSISRCSIAEARARVLAVSAERAPDRAPIWSSARPSSRT